MPLRVHTLLLFVALPVVGVAEDPPVEVPVSEIVEFSIAEREAALSAPLSSMNQPPSTELSEAIRVGTVEELKVEKFTHDMPAELIEEIIKYPHAGNRVNVYVTTKKKDSPMSSSWHRR